MPICWLGKLVAQKLLNRDGVRSPMTRLLLHKLGHLMAVGARTTVQLGMTLFLTKQMILRDWFEKAIS